MNTTLKKILPALFCLLSLIFLYAFRTVPQSKLWKGWTLVYVMSDSLTEGEALTILGEAGCSKVIAKSQQREPVVSPLSPLQFSDASSYIQRRLAFFSDASEKALVFYVPDGQNDALSRAIEALEARGARCGTDSAVSFPYLPSLLTLVFALAVIALAAGNRRLEMALMSLFFLALAFSRPLFSVAACSCIALAGICVFLKIMDRSSFVRRAKNSPVAVLLLIVPFFILCASQPVNGILYLLAFSGAISAMQLVAVIKALYYARFPHAFVPLYIRSARGISIVTSRNLYVLVSLTLLSLLLLCLSLFGGTMQAAGSSTERPALPAPVARSDGQLPDMDDFMAWSWKIASFPYRRLTEKSPSSVDGYPEEGERVVTPSFKDVGGSILLQEETKLVFNSDFRDGAIEAVKQAPYPALEQMMLRQGKNARYAFVRGGARARERLGTVTLLVCVTLSAGLAAYFILARRRYGFGK